MKKRILGAILSIVTLFSFTACNGAEQGGSSTEIGNPEAVEFWSIPATEKVLQKEVDGVSYDDIKSPAAVTTDAFKGEYESAQIIMTASEDVKSYNAKVSDLTSADGNNFSADNISIRKEMYIEVYSIKDPKSGASTGWYPDALVPLSNIVEAGENTIAKGENQGLYITFDVPTNQTAGTYTGLLTITYDGNDKNIPITLNVIDYAISETTRSYSYFCTDWQHHLGELESSKEMYREYVKFLAEYRLSAGRMMHYDSFSLRSDEGINEYVEETWDLVKNYNVPNFDIPMTHDSGMDSDLLEKYIVAFAKKSIEVNFNLLEISEVYGSAIDEPYDYGEVALNAVTQHEKAFKEGRVKGAASIRTLKTGDSATDSFIEELAKSAEEIALVVTTYYTEDFEKAGVETYCPKVNECDTEKQRAQYADQKEKWWYTCMYPRAPYPTYHIEDNLISARSLGWMMTEYGIKGNLFWACDIYGKGVSKASGVVYSPIEDYYADALRYPAANGDGFLLYPGSKYGIYGPVASMRLEAIRDGNEEYEILYDLREAYEKNGCSADKIQRYISNLFYSGTVVKSDYEKFNTARSAVAQLVMLATSPAEVCISDVSEDAQGNFTYQITANSDYEIKNNGKVLSAVSAANGRSVYSLKIDRAVDGVVALSVNAGGKEYTFDYNVGKIDKYTAEQVYSESSFAKSTATVNAKLDGGKIKLTVGSVKNNIQGITFTSNILSSLGSSRGEVVLHVETTEKTYFKLSVKFKNGSNAYSVYDGTLKAGSNEVSMDLSSYSYKSYGEIEKVYMYFSSKKGTYEEKTLYIGGMDVHSN